MGQLHKKFTDSQVKELLERCLRKEVHRKYIQETFGIGQTRFFALVKSYRRNPKDFSVRYSRRSPTRELDPKIEKNILEELTSEKKLIQDLAFPFALTITAISKTDSHKLIARRFLCRPSLTVPRPMAFI